jgi:tRNA threonylcarbamoyladenosine dehydratase
MVSLTEDHVVFLGDLVSKGPQSHKVVKLAMKLNASCVIGNHDYDLLDWMGYINTVGDAFVNPEERPREFVLGVEQYSKGMGFSHEAAQWLLHCPFILKVGKVDGEELVAVHAGLLPGKSLEEQGNFSHNVTHDHRTMDTHEYAQCSQRRGAKRNRPR